LKFILSHRLSASLALLVLALLPTQLLAQATPDSAASAPQPRSDLNTMPKWSDFPVPPTNVTTNAEYQADVNETLAKRRQLRTEVRALVWDGTVPESYAKAARDRLDPAQMTPIDPQTTPAQIDALAAELRKRAAPPPVIK
jgi:hypothetical protein